MLRMQFGKDAQLTSAPVAKVSKAPSPLQYLPPPHCHHGRG